MSFLDPLTQTADRKLANWNPHYVQGDTEINYWSILNTKRVE